MMAIPQLQRLRNGAALSQRDLARLAGVSQVTIVRAEKGEPVFPSTVRKLAAGLRVTARELAFGGEQ